MCCDLALQRLRGWQDVDEELKEMRLEEQSERAEGQMSVLTLFTLRSLRWQLLSIIFMNMGQQLSGVNAVSIATLTTSNLCILCIAIIFSCAVTVLAEGNLVWLQV